MMPSQARRDLAKRQSSSVEAGSLTPSEGLPWSPRHTQETVRPARCCRSAAQPCPTVCDPVGCSPPGSSVHGILQARRLEWVAISFSRGSSRPRDRTCISGIAGGIVTPEKGWRREDYRPWSQQHTVPVLALLPG